MTAGHAIRDRVFKGKSTEITDTGETFDCVVVRGNQRARSGSLLCEATACRTCLVLDNHPMFGEKRAQRVRSGWKAADGAPGLGPHASRRTLRIIWPASMIQSVSIGSSSISTMDGSEKAPEIQTAPYGVGGPTLGFYFGAKFGAS